MVLLAAGETGIERATQTQGGLRLCHAVRSRVPISIIGARMRQCVVARAAVASWTRRWARYAARPLDTMISVEAAQSSVSTAASDWSGVADADL